MMKTLNYRSTVVTAAFCSLLLFAAAGFAQEEAATHRIDAAQAKCLRTAKATMPRAECYSKASEAWDKDLADTYAKLLKAVTEESKSVIERSQTAWEAYRDAEFAVIAHFYNKKKGTGYIAVRITKRMDIVRTRALQLEAWLSIYQ